MYKKITSIMILILCIITLNASKTWLYGPPACHMIMAATYKKADPILAWHPLWLLRDIALHTHNLITLVTSVHTHWPEARDFIKITILYIHLGATFICLCFWATAVMQSYILWPSFSWGFNWNIYRNSVSPLKHPAITWYLTTAATDVCNYRKKS